MEKNSKREDFMEQLKKEEEELKRFAKKRIGCHIPIEDIVLDTSVLEKPATRGRNK